jgi:putative spermidine/putrescine transport system substrate-binding protein
MTFVLSRRSVLQAGGALAALAVGGRPALSACDAVAVATWGGDYQKFLIEGVEPVLKGNKLEALYDVTRPSERKTKLYAERNLRSGTMGVVLLNAPDMQEMFKAGTLIELDAAKMPNAKNIDPRFAASWAIPHIYSAQSILYNRDEVKAAPDSYAVFWDPRYKGRVGIQRHLWVNWFEIAAILAGGTPSDYEPGKQLLLELKKNEPKVYPSQEHLAVALKNGEVWLTPNWRARGYMWRKEGMPLADAAPKEGMVPVLYQGGIAKGLRDKECGYGFLDAMLAPQAQSVFAANMGYLPTVANATVPPDLLKEIGFTEAEKEKFWQQDYDYVGRNFQPWGEWWEKSFLA